MVTALGGRRVSKEDRRERLLDAAAALISGDGVDAVSMEAVADRAGVSRPLVYKHFSNRGTLLSELYRREARSLHRALSDAVTAAPTVAEAFGALMAGSLRAAAEEGHRFSALRAAGAFNQDLRAEQRGRDRFTIRYFASRVAAEYTIPAAEATATAAMLLALIDNVLAQFRHRPTPQQSRLLMETYMQLVTGGLKQLGDR